MQAKKTRRKSTPGRPRTSTLDPVAQARERKRRQRARMAKDGYLKVEVFLPPELEKRVRIAAKGKPLSFVGAEAFQAWLDLDKTP